jgi:isoquinoline 1-oxidoreductase alpha subunit
MSAVALLKNNPQPTDEDIMMAMNGNLCRCGTYDRIQKGIKRAAMAIKTGSLPVNNK